MAMNTVSTASASASYYASTPASSQAGVDGHYDGLGFPPTPGNVPKEEIEKNDEGLFANNAEEASEANSGGFWQIWENNLAYDEPDETTANVAWGDPDETTANVAWGSPDETGGEVAYNLDLAA